MEIVEIVKKEMKLNIEKTWDSPTKSTGESTDTSFIIRLLSYIFVESFCWNEIARYNRIS